MIPLCSSARSDHHIVIAWWDRHLLECWCHMASTASINVFLTGSFPQIRAYSVSPPSPNAKLTSQMHQFGRILYDCIKWRSPEKMMLHKWRPLTQGMFITGWLYWRWVWGHGSWHLKKSLICPSGHLARAPHLSPCLSIEDFIIS